VARLPRGGEGFLAELRAGVGDGAIGEGAIGCWQLVEQIAAGFELRRSA
jgi:hypothetical protein